MQQQVNPTSISQDINSIEYKKLMQEIQKILQQKYPKAIIKRKSGDFSLLKLQELEKKMAEQNPNQNTTPSKGRGGNNVAQNMKKSVLSIMKKRLSAENYEEFEKRYIKTYEMKSQKENYILYFLFLHEILSQRKITRQTLENMKSDIISRVQKYIKNTQTRMEQEPERLEFHQKNLAQFQKYLQIDLDFSRPRQYSEVRNWIKGQYLKKRAVNAQAQKKVRKIVQKHPAISQIFIDLNAQVKSQAVSSSEEKSSQIEYEIKQQNNDSS